MAIRGFAKQICFKFVISNTNAHIQIYVYIYIIYILRTYKFMILKNVAFQLNVRRNVSIINNLSVAFPGFV